MKKIFVFLGVCGTLLIIGVASALFIGIPSNPKDIIKEIKLK